MLKFNQQINNDTLNNTFLSKKATGTQIVLGSLNLIGSLTAGDVTLKGSLNTGNNNITTTGTINAASFVGSGASLTSLNATSISSGTLADARLSTNVALLNSAQTITANKTHSATSNLYFAGGTTYKIDTVGSAFFNALKVDGIVTLDGDDYIAFGLSGLAAPSDTSLGTKIKLYGNSYQIGVDTGTVWYDANASHKFYTNEGGTTRTLRAEITTTELHAYNNLIVDKNLEVRGEVKSGSYNEFPDPYLVATNGNWTVSSGSILFDPVQAPKRVGAGGSLRLTTSGAGAIATYNYKFEVLPNEHITVSMYSFATTASVPGKIYVTFYDANDALVTPMNATNMMATSWTRYSLTVETPVTATYFKVGLGNDGTTGSIMYATAFQVERGKALTGFKPYQGGKEISLAHNGINSLIHSTYPLKIDQPLSVNTSMDIAGTSATLNVVHSADSGEAVLNVMGSGEGTGRVFVGQSSTHGGGIEHNGDGTPTGSGSGADYFSLYRRSDGINYWTARNLHSSNNWEFRGSVTIGAGVIVTGSSTFSGGLTSAGITLSSGALTHTTADSYDKIRLSDSSQQTLGMKSGVSYGYIVNNTAMTFTMNNVATRGFLWRDEADATNDGAMSLTTDGKLYLKDIASVGTLSAREKITVASKVLMEWNATEGSLDFIFI